MFAKLFAKRTNR